MGRPTADASTIVRRNRDVIFSRFDDDVLAIDAEAGNCYSLNESAAMVWDLIAEPRAVRSVCDRLREEYEVDEGTCMTEVLRVVGDLHDVGLVALGDPGA